MLAHTHTHTHTETDTHTHTHIQSDKQRNIIASSQLVFTKTPQNGILCTFYTYIYIYTYIK